MSQDPKPIPADDPSQILTQMTNGFILTKLLHTVATLGIADLLADGPKPVAELAASTGTHADSLYRVLRALASSGVFAEGEERVFHLTPIANLLRSDVEGSMRAWTRMRADDWIWQSYGAFEYSLRTGAPSFQHVFGTGVWEYLGEHPEQGANFDQAMTSLSNGLNQPVVAAYDFTPFHTVCDIAGGHGSLISTMLQSSPALRGILFDAHRVLAGAGDTLASYGVADRCTLFGGDFFESVPDGADLYTMKFIIHDWDDERSRIILNNIRKVIPANGKLLLFESVILPGNEPSFGKLIDIEMLTIPGGRERSEREFAQLFSGAGFRLTRVIPTACPLSVIEAEPV